jgi:hypothetical protein
MKVPSPKSDEPDAIQRAIEYGVDITLLEENLKRTPTERLENFRWLAFAAEIRRAGEMSRRSDATRREKDI